MIPIIILIHFFSLKVTKKKALAFANFEAIERFSGKKILTKNLLLLILRSLVILFLVLSVAGAKFQYTGRASEHDFVLAIDASGSMLAQDYDPDRISAARNAAISFVDSLPVETSVGLISFAGSSFVKQRLTNDLSKVKGSVEDLEIETVGGTAIGGALIESANILSEGKKSKIIILLTDGQNNVGASLENAIEYVNENGALVHTIGIGTVEGGSFPDFNETFVSVLDEAGLKQIASQTGGNYYLAESEEELDTVFEQIASIKRQKVDLSMEIYFLIVAVLILLFEWSLMSTRYRTIP